MKKKFNEDLMIYLCFGLLTILIIISSREYKSLNDDVIADQMNLNVEIEYKNDDTENRKEIVWDNLSLEELTIKLDNNLYDTLKGTGKYFAEYTKATGLDPYLAVSIVNLETGCKWGCSSLTRNCFNIGGIKGKPSCNGSSYKCYNSLEDGIKGFLDLIYYNYYSVGLDTPEKMNSKYAEDPGWAEKVNRYYDTIKES